MNTFREEAQAPAVLAIALLMLIAGACARQSRPRSQGSDQTSAPPDPVIEVSSADDASSSDDPCSQMFSNFFVAVDSISYNEYEIVRLHKVVRDTATGLEIPVSYAVLKSKGNVITTFDGVYVGAGNAIDFGFAPLLGGETNQLIVSQTIPRNGRHWVVDLSSNATTVFDSNEWDLGQEDVCVRNSGGDGFAELSLFIRKFCGIGAMSTVECPMIGVVFKYDPLVRRYLPDRLAFAHELDGIDEDVKKIDPVEPTQGSATGSYLAKRLDIFLRYAYGGRENDGWLFFDRSYNLPDKKEIEQEIRAALHKEPVYKFVYGEKPGVTK